MKELQNVFCLLLPQAPLAEAQVIATVIALVMLNVLMVAMQLV